MRWIEKEGSSTAVRSPTLPMRATKRKRSRGSGREELASKR
jgi:hypothetical protein